MANSGGDTVKSISEAAQFGVVRGGQSLAALLIYITDVKAPGLQTAQGLLLTEAFYWDRDEGSRAFSKRFTERMGRGRVPTAVHAAVYSSVLHYLKAVEALHGASDGAAVVAKMKELPTDDPLLGRGSVRIDGRKLHDLYLFEVEQPAESKGEWDLYRVAATIPAAGAFRPLTVRPNASSAWPRRSGRLGALSCRYPSLPRSAAPRGSTPLLGSPRPPSPTGMPSTSLLERMALGIPKPLQATVTVQRAKAYVEANLGDVTLDPAKIAAAAGVSLRQLHQLFHNRLASLSSSTAVLISAAVLLKCATALNTPMSYFFAAVSNDLEAIMDLRVGSGEVCRHECAQAVFMRRV